MRCAQTDYRKGLASMRIRRNQIERRAGQSVSHRQRERKNDTIDQGQRGQDRNGDRPGEGAQFETRNIQKGPTAHASRRGLETAQDSGRRRGEHGSHETRNRTVDQRRVGVPAGLPENAREIVSHAGDPSWMNRRKQPASPPGEGSPNTEATPGTVEDVPRRRASSGSWRHGTSSSGPGDAGRQPPAPLRPCGPTRPWAPCAERASAPS